MRVLAENSSMPGRAQRAHSQHLPLSQSLPPMFVAPWFPASSLRQNEPSRNVLDALAALPAPSHHFLADCELQQQQQKQRRQWQQLRPPPQRDELMPAGMAGMARTTSWAFPMAAQSTGVAVKGEVSVKKE